jgi:hypothetical protein
MFFILHFRCFVHTNTTSRLLCVMKSTFQATYKPNTRMDLMCLSVNICLVLRWFICGHSDGCVSHVSSDFMIIGYEEMRRIETEPNVACGKANCYWQKQAQDSGVVFYDRAYTGHVHAYIKWVPTGLQLHTCNALRTRNTFGVFLCTSPFSTVRNRHVLLHEYQFHSSKLEEL